MGLGKILALVNEGDGANPKFLVAMLLESVADDFRFADVGGLFSCVRVNAEQKINSALGEFLAGE